MIRVDEDILNAYADGELSADRRAEVEELLKSDVGPRNFVEKLRRTDVLTKQAFDAPMLEPSNAALVATILGAPSRPARDNVAPLDTTRTRAGIRRYAMQIAATIVLAIGVASGVFLGRYQTQAPEELALGRVAAESQLHRLLESIPSGRDLETGTRAGVLRHRVVATFQDRHGRVCREVEFLRAATERQPDAAGVACRSSSGDWQMEGAVRLAKAPASSGQQFETSGISERDALEGLLQMLGAKTALTAEQEQALMQSGWQ